MRAILSRSQSLLPLLLVLSLVGCGSNPTREDGGKAPERSAHGGYGTSSSATFADNPAALRFAQTMQQRHGYDAQAVMDILSRAHRESWIIAQMDKQADHGPRRSSAPSAPTGAWLRYRAKFVTADNIDKGVAFWQQYRGELQRASATYGVPPEIIVGIIGVETRWGRIMGKTRIIDALATLSFAYPRRADYFSTELEAFLLMTREEGIDPFQPTGSFAGAMGYGQFMPSSIRQYGVDFNGDHHRTLWHPVDAIGSVANYFKGHGWRTGEPVVVRASAGPAAGSLQAGFDTSYSLATLAGAGITPAGSLGGAGTVSLLKFDVGTGYDYWLGLHNFYVITRYNHSTYYAMAVYQLGSAVKARLGGGDVRVAGLP
ncbi:lytic murein transglycosylase B [uncultured Thiodictyon sp.]|uniref:lytic murein transglycosylase B n=1 Tax=uncultured Thiodictyon sp. TaxID=1846217 RepID=UPI0025DEF71C|nr:lytic murein transglycosylase B [uncultured Thiodictyon sp.]